MIYYVLKGWDCMLGRKCKKVSTKGLALILAFTGTILAAPKPVVKAETKITASSINVLRLAGDDRYATSLAISRQGWLNSDYAILATGENYPDALSAAPLAKKYACPIILISKYSINDNVLSELKRLHVKEAFILGGTGIIASSVDDKLSSNSITPTRIAGTNRYETSVKIAEKLGTNDEVIVTTGEDFADALSISSIASSKNIPILLTPKDSLESSVTNFINTKKIYKSYIIGDTSSISQGVYNQFANLNPERIDGTDKYERNININKKFSDSIDYSTVFIATGNDYPDSLSGAALASRTNSPVILVNSSNINGAKELLKDKNIKNVFVLGGVGAVPNSIKDAIFGTTSSPQDLKTVTVTNIKELLENIAPDTKIILKSGDYDLLTPGAANKQYVVYEKVYDGSEVHIKDVSNLTIQADTDARVNFLIDPRYANVLSFDNCSNINITGLVAGHYKDKGACVGGVFKFEDCSSIQINNCDLYGCGIEGLTLNNVKDFQFINSTVRDCSYGVMTINSSSNLSFTNSTFKGNKEYYGFNITQSDLTFDKCTISNNEIGTANLFDVDAYSNVKISNSTIENNTAGKLTNGDKNIDLENTTLKGNSF